MIKESISIYLYDPTYNQEKIQVSGSEKLLNPNSVISFKVSEEISLRYILLMIVTELTRKLKSDLTRKAKVITNRVFNAKNVRRFAKHFAKRNSFHAWRQ